MANNISNVSFTDYASEQAEIARRQQLAQALQAQAMAPGRPTQMAGNIAIRESPLAGLAKVAQAFGGEYVSKQAQQKQTELAKKYKDDLASTLSKAMSTYRGTPGQSEIPMPPEDQGGGPGRAAVAPVAGDPMAAAMMMMGHPQTAPMAGGMMTEAMKSQKLAQALAGAGFGGAGGASAPGMPGAGGAGGAGQPAQQGGIPPGVNPLAWSLAVANGDIGKLAEMTQSAHQEQNKPILQREGDVLQRNPDGSMKSVFQSPRLPAGMTPNRDASGQVTGASQIPVMGGGTVPQVARDTEDANKVFTVKLDDGTETQGTLASLRQRFPKEFAGAVPQPQQRPQPQPYVGAAPNRDAALSQGGQMDARGQQFNITVPPQVGSQTPGDVSARKIRDAAGVERAQKDAQRSIAFEEKIPVLSSTLRRLDRLESLTKDDKTYAAAGAEIKTQLGSIAQALGLPIAKEKTANTEEYISHFAELLKERLSSKDYGSGTAVSNLDLLAAGRPLPEVMRTQGGRLQVIQALKADANRSLSDANAARQYFDKNSSLTGFRYPSEQENTPYGVPLSALRDGQPERRAAPQGIPQGSKVIGKTPAGKNVYQSPDGKKWTE